MRATLAPSVRNRGIAQNIRAALLAIDVLANWNGLSAMVFAVLRLTFEGECLAETLHRVTQPTGCL